MKTIFQNLFLFLILTGSISYTWAGVYSDTGHGNPNTGVMRDAKAPRGSCRQCHIEDSKGIKYPKGLWQENDNGLCYTCHFNDDITGVYPGQRIYETSGHKIDPRFVWPGPFPAARREIGFEGKCLNCHDPHGKKDRNGLIPSLLITREENLCLACHDGYPSSKDIARELQKPFTHSVFRSSEKHSSDEGDNPDKYSYITGNLHVECSDCHNAHSAFGDSGIKIAPQASNRNSRVSRIRVINGSAGSRPTYQYIVANDTSLPVLEYEICFKCHSSWTQQRPGEPDLSRLFNTNNASYHPVEGQGKNPGIDPNSFAVGINSFSTIYCIDCHGSDDSDIRGPHGSQFPNILKKAYEAQSSPRITSSDELCFICHNFDTYASDLASDVVKGYSRWNETSTIPGSAEGHTFHVGRQNYPCYACHDSHGSPQFGALIITGRTPGIFSFNMSSRGGSCTATCHAPKSYVVNYSR